MFILIMARQIKFVKSDKSVVTFPVEFEDSQLTDVSKVIIKKSYGSELVLPVDKKTNNANKTGLVITEEEIKYDVLKNV